MSSLLQGSTCRCRLLHDFPARCCFVSPACRRDVSARQCSAVGWRAYRRSWSFRAWPFPTTCCPRPAVLGEWTKVHLLDLPGYTGSGQPTRYLDVWGYGQTVAHWLEASRIEGSLVVGHSSGTQVAAWAGVLCQDRVAAVGLASPHGRPDGAVLGEVAVPLAPRRAIALARARCWESSVRFACLRGGAAYARPWRGLLTGRPERRRRRASRRCWRTPDQRIVRAERT